MNSAFGEENSSSIAAIFQFSENQLFSQNFVTPSYEAVTMGLDSQQINTIHELTEGRVNFKNIYRLKVTDLSNLSTLPFAQGFSSFTDSSVPPPVIMGKGY
jgi:hypothetical protein